MKQIKNGKIYDTEQSEQIAHYNNGLSKRDFGYIRETLYRTENGNFFIVGKGGAKTGYSKSVEGGRSGGSKLIAKDESEVIQWLDQRDIDIDEVDFDFTELVEEA